MDAERRPTCTGCRHYYVTWDPERPHGCRGFGFASAQLPARVVEHASGLECQRREPRPERPDATPAH